MGAGGIFSARGGICAKWRGEYVEARMRYRSLLALALCTLLGACGAQPTAVQPTSPVATAGPTQAASPPLATSSPVPTRAAPTAVASPTPAETPTLAPGMFVNPVIDQDFPDPDALRVGDIYYAYATNSGSANVQVARSRDLVSWQRGVDVLPRLPAWAERGNTWAPEATTTADGKGFLLYFVARVAGTTRQCIGVASSEKPDGPFQSPGEQPFICQADQGGSIDPSSFVDDDGARYLLWKNDGNCCGGKTWLYIQKVSADGQALEGEPTQLLSADQAWEGILVEAPTLWKHNGKYYLFYSANDYASPRYAVGYAVAESPLGPYQKAKQPLLASNIKNAVVGPGGQDIVLDKDNETWMLYHSWGPGYRSMSIDALVWEGDTPVLQGPNGRRMPQPAP
jgi:beta-xylosidase